MTSDLGTAALVDGDPTTVMNEAVLAENEGDLAAARDRYEDALQIARASGNREDEAEALSNLVTVALQQATYKMLRIMLRNISN